MNDVIEEVTEAEVSEESGGIEIVGTLPEPKAPQYTEDELEEIRKLGLHKEGLTVTQSSLNEDTTDTDNEAPYGYTPTGRKRKKPIGSGTRTIPLDGEQRVDIKQMEKSFHIITGMLARTANMFYPKPKEVVEEETKELNRGITLMLEKYGKKGLEKYIPEITLISAVVGFSLPRLGLKIFEEGQIVLEAGKESNEETN